jgi:hypothetical protein
MLPASRLTIAAAVLCCTSALAQTISVSEPTVTRGQGWSLYSGYTVGGGNTALAAQLGWPGISASVLHGATPKFDLGGRVAFNYGFEGIVTDVLPGLKFQGLARISLLDSQQLGLALEFSPGPFFYFGRVSTLVGLGLPVGLSAGIPVGSAIMLNAGMDVPMFIRFGAGGYFTIPLLFGGGVEYFIDRNLAASFNLKMGPAINTRVGRADFAFHALLGVAYRL